MNDRLGFRCVAADVATEGRATCCSQPGLFGGRVWILACFFGVAILASLVGGCADGEKALLLQDEAQFQKVAVEADKPVLVMFFKGGCASCAALESTFNQLAQEYKGRAVVARFMILTFVFGVNSPELKERYGVVFVPHVALLAHGQEKKHWIMEYSIDAYRKGLDEVLAQAGPTTPSTAAKPPPAKAGS